MIALIQCVNYASVRVDGQVVADIKRGGLVFVGVEKSDTSANVLALFDKLRKLRVFPDEQGKMNLNIEQAQGEILLVPQFTLAADTKKGNRPGFEQAADPKTGKQLFKELCHCFKAQTDLVVGTGVFQADMKVALENNGPLTFWLQK